MTVYIDNANLKFKGMRMCHMVADTPAELHEMADKIGLRRSWFQDKSSIPHYDVSLSKKALAIMHGAEPITSKELVGKFDVMAKHQEETDEPKT